MTALTAWTKGLVAVMILCGVLRAAVPAGRMKSAFAVLCAAIVLRTALTGLPNLSTAAAGVGTLFATNAAAEDFAAAQTQTAVLAAQSSLAQQANDALKGAGLPFSVRVTCSAENDALRVDAIRVRGQGTPAQQTAAAAVLQPFCTAKTKLVWETEAAP